mmetsp:Transcript_34480/g.77270  ORF Transcript_34480/g.77270 Transcript_34480/m.77270 type:complete len:899 (+) Transcript_34480:107-2803(+)
MAQVAPLPSPTGNKKASLDVPMDDEGHPTTVAWQDHLKGSRQFRTSLTQNLRFSGHKQGDITANRTSFLEVIKPQLLDEEEEELPLSKARMPIKSLLFTTTFGKVILLMSSAGSIITAGALTWYIVGGLDAMDDVGDGFWDIWKACIWMSWGLFFDPGTQTGVSSGVPSQVLYTAMFFSIIGFLWMLSTFGIIVEGVRSYLAQCEKEYSRVVASGHMLILGWSDKTPFLLEEMFQEAHNRGKPLKKVVILAERDSIEMRQTLYNHLSHSELGAQTRVLCRSGDISDPKQLQKVSAHCARDIIVLAPDGPPQEADLKVIRVVLALAAVPEALGGRVIVEVRCADTAPILEELLPPPADQVGGKARIEGIHSRISVNRMLCLMAKKPVVGDCLVFLSSFADGEELYLINPPAMLHGQPFAKAILYFQNALAVGTKPYDGEKGEIDLAPPDDQIIRAGDKLLLIAKSQESIDEENRRDHKYVVTGDRSPSCDLQAKFARPWWAPWRGSATTTTTRSSLSNLSGGLAAKARKLLLTGTESGVEAPLDYIPPNIRGYFGASGEKSVFIVLGFADDFYDLMQSMDFYVRPGSVVHVLSEKTIAARTSKQMKDKEQQLENLEIVHREGSTFSVEKLSSLPLSEAHAILILAEGNVESTTSDSKCIAAAVTICGLCQGSFGKHRQRVLKGRVICEILSPQTDVIINRNAELRKKVVFFRSNALETGLFAMASSEPAIFNTLVLLISPSHSSGKIVAFGLRRYLTHEELIAAGETENMSLRFSFQELYQRVRAGGDILIGWHRLEDPRTKLGTNIDRREVMQWSPEDNLVVLKRPKDGEVATVLRRRTGRTETSDAQKSEASIDAQVAPAPGRDSPSPAPSAVASPIDPKHDRQADNLEAADLPGSA